METRHMSLCWKNERAVQRPVTSSSQQEQPTKPVAHSMDQLLLACLNELIMVVPHVKVMQFVVNGL